ncbi:hypothetical protein DQ392_25045 [Streptomyces reniochalinae]|uniref:Uncharacterized protein n=1 Tax=Streptomyces reniochalinae TaxID=2250578 RepID=A0A367EBS9_9ACTN|nr:hypothetical protein DQ392_25045 [Streptomyces reniochalinae]
MSAHHLRTSDLPPQARFVQGRPKKRRLILLVQHRLRLDDPPGVVVYRYGDQLLPVSRRGGPGAPGASPRT